MARASRLVMRICVKQRGGVRRDLKRGREERRATNHVPPLGEPNEACDTTEKHARISSYFQEEDQKEMESANSLKRHNLDKPTRTLVAQLDHLLELSELLVAVDDAILDHDELVRSPVDLENSVRVEGGLIRGKDVEPTETRRTRVSPSVRRPPSFTENPLSTHVFVS